MNQYTNNIVNLKDREENFIKRLKETYPTFEYVGGYINSDKPVILKCKICGDVFKRNADCVRAGRKAKCIKCRIINNTKKKLLQKQQSYLNKKQLEIKKNRKLEIEKIYKQLKKKTIYIKVCSKCGNEYTEHTNSIYCSKCRKRVHDKHSYKSLNKLYKRDNGICYLCGNVCDWNDYVIDKETIIVGKTYPSIDHVIPLSKGGTDDWNNIRLAHFECNRLKGACLKN